MLDENENKKCVDFKESRVPKGQLELDGCVWSRVVRVKESVSQ